MRAAIGRHTITSICVNYENITRGYDDVDIKSLLPGSFISEFGQGEMDTG